MIQRFGGSQIKAALPALRKLARDLRERIAGGEATDFQMGRMVSLERDVQQLITAAREGIQGQLELEDFAVEEYQFGQNLLSESVNVDLGEGVNLDRVRAITTRRRMRLVSGDKVRQMTIPEMWRDFDGAVGRDAMRVVQAGVLEGKTQQDMAREVAQMVTTRSRRQAESVIRTAVNGIGTAAREQVYRDNDDIIEGEKWISTLDGRTSDVCRARDGKIYPVGHGPRPPAHYGCRSLTAPEIKEQYRVAIKGQRASKDGPVSNQLTYGGWLKKQPDEFVDDVLGPTRAKLFREGKVKIDQFVDDSGRTLTLDQLRQRYNITME